MRVMKMLPNKYRGCDGMKYAGGAIYSSNKGNLNYRYVQLAAVEYG
jgi:hypothetical protein